MTNYRVFLRPTVWALLATIPLLFLLWVTSVWAVGTTTLSQSRNTGGVRRIIFDWVSTAGGAVDGTLTAPVNGRVVAMITDPGTPAPTTLYDIVIVNDEGFDILAAQGQNRSATLSEMVTPGIPFKDGTTTSVAPMYVAGTLELRVTNAGAAAQGRVVLLVVDR